VLERTAYLNAGSFGPLAATTVEAVRKRLRIDVEEGRSGAAYADAMLALRDQARTAIGGLLSVSPENVAITTSTTRACNIAIGAVGLRPGEEVVTTDAEHFGLLGPLHASGARVRVASVRERPAKDALEAILAEVGPRTRLLALSHVSWMTGHVYPVDELREAVSLPILVDGAQSVGAIPADARGFDFYTVSGQKWLCGPDATGALYVRDPDGWRIAAPSYFAQEDYQVDGSFSPKAGAARFDADGISLPALAGLVAAMEHAPKWRFDRAAAAARRCRELLLEAGTEVVTEPGHATLVSFRPKRASPEVVEDARAAGVVVRYLPKTSWVRASCGYWTSDADLERLVAVV
jgi:L-cysteine/cystine lyase